MTKDRAKRHGQKVEKFRLQSTQFAQPKEDTYIEKMLGLVTYVLMPVITTIAGVRIYMYFNDHHPPHFHARHDGEEEVFDLEGNSLRGSIDKKKGKKVREWAKENSEELKNRWDDYQQ